VELKMKRSFKSVEAAIQAGFEQVLYLGLEFGLIFLNIDI
jgi:hypothetical protein